MEKVFKEIGKPITTNTFLTHSNTTLKNYNNFNGLFKMMD